MQCSRQHLRRERLLGTEGRLKRRAEAVEKRDPRRRLRVEDVSIGEVGDRRQGCDRARRRPELGPRSQRLATRHDQRPGAARIAVGRAQRRARWIGCNRAAAGTARGEQAGARDQPAERLATGYPPAHPLSPFTTVSRGRAAGDPHDRDRARDEQPDDDHRDLRQPRAKLERRVVDGEVGERRTQHEPLDHDADHRGREHEREDDSEQQPRYGHEARSGGTENGDGAAALLEGDRAGLEQRVQAHEPVDDRHDPEDRAQRVDQRHAARRRSGGRGRWRTQLRQRLAHRGLIGAGVEADRDLLGRRRVVLEQRCGRYVGDAAVVVERADHAGDPQPKLAPAREVRSRASNPG